MIGPCIGAARTRPLSVGWAAQNPEGLQSFFLGDASRQAGIPSSARSVYPRLATQAKRTRCTLQLELHAPSTEG